MDVKRNSRLLIYLVLVAILYGLLVDLNINGFIAIGLSLFLPFGKEEFSRKVFDYFANFYSVIISVSAFVWIFVLLNKLSPLGTLEPIDPYSPINYSVFPFVVRSNGESFFRFCGLFDEPGVVGTFNAILLYILGFNIKDWRTYALILSGILSLSLFFYVMVFGYYAINNILKINVKAVLLVTIIVSAFYIITKEDVFFNEMLWERIEWDDSKGGVAGDNRTNDNASDLYKSKMFTSDYWFGSSNKKDLEYFEGSSSYKAVVLSCGMICFSLYVIFFILMALNRKKGIHLILFLFLLLATFYQRPWMFGMGYLFLFPYYARYDRILKN